MYDVARELLTLFFFQRVEAIGVSMFTISLMGGLFQLGLSQAHDTWEREVHRLSTRDQPHPAGGAYGRQYHGVALLFGG